jgi:hypothetical protein
VVMSVVILGRVIEVSDLRSYVMKLAQVKSLLKANYFGLSISQKLALFKEFKSFHKRVKELME